MPANVRIMADLNMPPFKDNYVIYYCIYAFLILFTRGLLAMFHKFFFEFHDAKIRVNRIGDLSKVAINSISLHPFP